MDPSSFIASPDPGPIDNSHLVSGGDPQTLKPYLQETLDFVLQHESVWEKLLEWYGGGPAIPRKVVPLGLRKKPQVEVYPLKIKVWCV